MARAHAVVRLYVPGVKESSTCAQVLECHWQSTVSVCISTSQLGPAYEGKAYGVT